MHSNLSGDEGEERYGKLFWAWLLPNTCLYLAAILDFQKDSLTKTNFFPVLAEDVHVEKAKSVVSLMLTQDVVIRRELFMSFGKIQLHI